MVNETNIIPMKKNETRVPYKIMSFDTEESSSHGDFPVPVKSYKKLATNITEYFQSLKITLTNELCKTILRRIIQAAFGYEDMIQIDLVYPKTTVDGKWTKKDKTLIESSKEQVLLMCEDWMSLKIATLNSQDDASTIEKMFEKQQMERDNDLANDDNSDNDSDNDYEDNEDFNDKDKITSKKHSNTIVDILCDKTYDRNKKSIDLNMSLNKCFPLLEGDKVTFIG